jgi:aminoglycoside phosphotransferase (APT) family kinase protein
MTESMNMNDVRATPTAEWIAAVRSRFAVERTVDSALTEKLERRATPAPGREDLHGLIVQMQNFLERRTEGPVRVTNLRRLSGGASKEQFAFDLDWIHGGRRRIADRMVLRRDPSESIVVTNRLREFQLLRAFDGVVPVPHAYWVDERGAELTRPALICGFAQGVQRPMIDVGGVTGIGIRFDAAHRERLAPQFIRHLASIHCASPAGIDLSAFDTPGVGTSQDAEYQLNWWARVWQEDMLEDIPLIHLAENWLRRNKPSLDHCSVVHGDYRTGNFLFDPETVEITAILDWELGYLGDRHADLAWILMPSLVTKDEVGRPLCTSLFSRESFLDAYTRISGLTIDERRLDYYTVLAYWKTVIMALGSGLRAANGAKTHQDIMLVWFAGLGYAVLESLRQALEKIG